MMFSVCRLIIVALLRCSQSVVAEEQQHVAAAAAVCSEDNSSPSPECSEESTTNKKLETIRLGLEWFTNPDHLPLIVAQKHGIFKSFGLDVQLIEPADHWEAEEEILAGRLDVAVTEPLHLAQDAAGGKPVLGFLQDFCTLMEEYCMMLVRVIFRDLRICVAKQFRILAGEYILL
jgi:ABC-type nitrate/sulfonate/bicarbonate transport system substrate-binding protein